MGAGSSGDMLNCNKTYWAVLPNVAMHILVLPTQSYNDQDSYGCQLSLYWAVLDRPVQDTRRQQ